MSKITVGRIELSKPVENYLRIQKYEVIDHLNELDRDVSKLIPEKEKREKVRDEFKRLKALVNNI